MGAGVPALVAGVEVLQPQMVRDQVGGHQDQTGVDGDEGELGSAHGGY